MGLKNYMKTFLKILYYNWQNILTHLISIDDCGVVAYFSILLMCKDDRKLI